MTLIDPAAIDIPVDQPVKQARGKWAVELIVLGVIFALIIFGG